MKLLSKGPSINSLIKRCVSAREGTVWYSKVQYSTVWYSTVQYSIVQYSTVLYQRFQRTKGAKGVKGQRVPRVPVSKAQKVYSGAGFSEELISDRA